MQRSSLPANRRRAGFTLVELVMVMVITGILAVAVVPRFFDVQDYRDLAFRDGTLAALRYAQKSAVAQRRMVCVAFSAGSVQLHIATAAGGVCVPGGGAGTVPLVSPTGASPYMVAGAGSAGFTATPASFGFNPLGQPVSPANQPLTAAINIPVARRPAIVIQPETGHVQ